MLEAVLQCVGLFKCVFYLPLCGFPISQYDVMERSQGCEFKDLNSRPAATNEVEQVT